MEEEDAYLSDSCVEHLGKTMKALCSHLHLCVHMYLLPFKSSLEGKGLVLLTYSVSHLNRTLKILGIQYMLTE